MKKRLKLISIILCVILAFCAFSACSTDEPAKEETAKEETAIVGKWVYESSDDMYYTFNEDGTGGYFFVGGEMKFTYTDDGTALTIQYENSTEPNVFKYTIKDDTLEIEDSFGEIVTYIKK